MELLRAWCNDELRLSRPVRSFEADFRNGLLIGEILHKHGLLDDMAAMSKGDGPHVMIQNFNVLQPALRKLNITLDSRVANQIMVEKPGVATNIVYQLKLALENATKSLATNLPPRRDRVDLSQTTLSTTRKLRAPHEEMRQRTFDQQLRMQAANPRELDMSHHLSRYTEAMYEMTRKALDEQQRDELAEKEQRAHRLSAQRERLRESRAFMDDWTRESAQRHAATLRSLKASQAEELKWELTARERQARLERISSSKHADELSSGLEQFERTLRQLGVAGGGDEDDAGGAEGDAQLEAAALALAADSSSHGHFARLQAMLPDAGAMAADAEGYMQRLRARKAEEAVSRKEREVRRRRVLLEQAKAQEELDAARRDEALLEKLGRQSLEEQRIAERLWRARQEGEVMRENSRLRQEQLEARRAQDMADRVARNKARAAARLVEYKAALARERARFSEAEAARAALRRERRVAECRRVAEELVAMAVRAHTFTGDAGRLLPARAWREMCTLFVAGVPLGALSGAGTTRVAEAEGGAEGADVPLIPAAGTDGRPSQLLNEADLSHYLAGTADWQPAALAALAEQLPEVDAFRPPDKAPSSAAEKAAAAAIAAMPEHSLRVGVELLAPQPEEAGAAVAGQAVYTLLDAVAPPPPPPPPPLLPEAKLRLAIVGRPFAGKSTTALAIALEANLELLLPSELVHAAIAEHAAAESARAAGGGGAARAEVEEGQSLGKVAADALAAGKPVPDAVVAALLVRAVAAIDEGRSGFLIDGFPTSPAQLQLLEKGLTGYEPVVDAKKKPPQSRLVPPPASAGAPPPPRKPGLDALVRLDISDELAMRRALGRRVDPVSGAVFHLEFAPPEEDADLQQRLVPLGSDAHAEAQLLPLLQAHKDTEGPLEVWGSALRILRKVDAAPRADEVLASVRQIVDELAEAKAALAREAAEAAAAAAPAEEAVTATEPAAAAGAPGGEPAIGESTPTAAAELPLPPLPLERVVAETLLERWRSLEGGYLSALAARLQLLRDAEWAVLQHSTSQAQAYARRLAEPDERQALVAAAQQAFNELEPELRADDEGKAELHARLDELQDALWALVDAKREACEFEAASMALSGFAQHSALHVLNATLAMAQAEADRCFDTLACMGEYYAARTGTWKAPPLPITRLEIAPASAVGVVLQLPKYEGLDTAAAQAASAQPKKGGGAAAAKKPPTGKGSAAAAPRELPTPMSGEGAIEQLLQRTRPLLALAEAIDAAVRTEEASAAAADAADAANAELPPAKAAHNRAVRALFAELLTLWRAEASKLRRRCRALCVHGAAALGVAKADLERLFATLDGWLGQRVRAELESIGALIKLMRAAVEAEAPLAQRLELADTPELVVDETLLLLPPRPPPDAPPPRQRADELRLSVAQVSRLAERFRAETRAPTLPLRAAIDVLLRAAAAGELPSVWRHFERTVLHEACRLFCSGHAQQLSWHALLCALAQTPVPTAEQLAETSAALQAASDGGWLTLAGWEATPLWFARSPAPADEGEEGGGEAAAIAAEFDVEAALKEALFHALATHSAGSPAKLHAQRFVLYACDSLPKAFAAMAPAHSGAVSADELHALLHRDMLPLSATATPVAVGAHADPFSMEVIHRLFGELNCDPQNDRVPYLMVANHPLGARVLNACELYRVNDVYGALAAKREEAGGALDI